MTAIVTQSVSSINKIIDKRGSQIVTCTDQLHPIIFVFRDYGTNVVQYEDIKFG